MAKCGFPSCPISVSTAFVFVKHFNRLSACHVDTDSHGLCLKVTFPVSFKSNSEKLDVLESLLFCGQ